MGEVLHMGAHKLRQLGCHDLADAVERDNANGPDTPERRTSAAAALARCVREIQQEFGKVYALECLANEKHRVLNGGKP